LSVLESLIKERREKLNKLIEMGISPYGYRFERTKKIYEIISKGNPEKEFKDPVALSGRLMSIRRMGKASFAHIMDQSGKIQIYVRKDKVGDRTYKIFSMMDIGDFIGVRGGVFLTKTGEITILVEELSLLSKSLRPLPIVKEKLEDDRKIVYDQFSDKELRYRQRYVDLVVNSDVREVFIKRSQIVSRMRRYLEERGYMEVETPVLQPLYGGAFARPFITHHNVLDIDLYLRIADELYLKRLIVGGYEGVFEISKDFRNEGMDRDHNPEFTMMELYVAYEDYRFMMDLTEDMISTICIDVFGTMERKYQGRTIDYKPPWERISYFEAIERYTGTDLYGKDVDQLSEAVKNLNVDIEECSDKGDILDEVFSQMVEPNLIQPTIVFDYPIELSPLAKRHRSEDGLAERFEGYCCGKEICNAFSELNDPIDQRERFEQQARLRAAGNEEAMVVDEDYLRAMEYGMPPTAGLGVGIDRLVMILTDMPSIRDVILFPHMRPERYMYGKLEE